MLKKSGIWKDIEKKGGCVNHTFCLTDLSVLLSPENFFSRPVYDFCSVGCGDRKAGCGSEDQAAEARLLFLDGSLYNDDILNHRYRCKFLGHLCIEG